MANERKTRLTKLDLEEVSIVASGDNPTAHHVLHKSAPDFTYGPVSKKGSDGYNAKRDALSTAWSKGGGRGYIMDFGDNWLIVSEYIDGIGSRYMRMTYGTDAEGLYDFGTPEEVTQRTYYELVGKAGLSDEFRRVLKGGTPMTDMFLRINRRKGMDRRTGRDGDGDGIFDEVNHHIAAADRAIRRVQRVERRQAVRRIGPKPYAPDPKVDELSAHIAASNHTRQKRPTRPIFHLD